MAKTATASTEAPRETAAQAQARERAAARQTRDTIRAKFVADKTLDDYEKLAEACSVVYQTAFNALTKGQHAQMRHRIARAELEEERQFVAEVRRVYKAHKPASLDELTAAMRAHAAGGMAERTRYGVQDALTPRQRETLQAREERARERELEGRRREEAKQDARKTRMRAKASAKANYVALPEKAKPSKATGAKHGNHMMNESVQIAREGRGEKTRWVLLATNSYIGVRIPVRVSNPRAITRGCIPPEAQAAVEKAGAFRVKGDAIQPLTITANGVKVGSEVQWPGETYETEVAVYGPTATEAGVGYVVPGFRRGDRFPQVAKVIPKEPGKRNRLEFTVDPTQLLAAAEAMGSKGRITLQFNLRDATKTDQGRRYVKGVRVVAGDCDGVVMPIDPSRAR